MFVTRTIPKDKLGQYSDYIGYLFCNEDGVYNICNNEEDIIKSNQWFKNLPLFSFMVSDKSISIGDKFLAICSNKELNGHIFKYVGENKTGVGLIDLLDEDDKPVISVKTLLDGSKRFERIANMADKEYVVFNQGHITTI